MRKTAILRSRSQIDRAEAAYYNGSKDPDHKSASHTREDKYREVGEDVDISHYKTRYYYLTEIMHDTSGHRDANRREYPCFFKDQHGEIAEQGTGQ